MMDASVKALESTYGRWSIRTFHAMGRLMSVARLRVDGTILMLNAEGATPESARQLAEARIDARWWT